MSFMARIVSHSMTRSVESISMMAKPVSRSVYGARTYVTVNPELLFDPKDTRLTATQCMTMIRELLVGSRSSSICLAAFNKHIWPQDSINGAMRFAIREAIGDRDAVKLAAACFYRAIAADTSRGEEAVFMLYACTLATPEAAKAAQEPIADLGINPGYRALTKSEYPWLIEALMRDNGALSSKDCLEWLNEQVRCEDMHQGSVKSIGLSNTLKLATACFYRAMVDSTPTKDRAIFMHYARLLAWPPSHESIEAMSRRELK